jgi:branched-chain amino acid transport system permease protein
VIEAIVAGCALGAVYALVSGGLMITYRSSGVMNFAFAAIAYFVARFYYFLHVQHYWGIVPAAFVTLLGIGPAIGLLLWTTLFRFIRLASPLIKIVVTVGLAVAIPPIAILLFGNLDISNPPGLAPQPAHTYQFLGTPVSLDQIIIYAFAAVILGGGAAILRWTSAGLLVRSVVDSDALSSLSGIRPARVAGGVWVASTFVAGVVGVVAAPIIGLDVETYTVLIAAAFAATVAARLSSVGVAAGVGLLIGILTGLAERYLPSSSQLTADAIPSIPFALLFVFLVYWAVRGRDLRQSQTVGGPLDNAIAPHGGSEVELATAATVAAGSDRSGLSKLARPLLFFGVVALLPLILHGVWLDALGIGIAYAVAFLSYTVSAGEGGMIWLCQITFAGMGAFTTAELATNHGWPLLPAMVVGGLLCALVGAVIGMLTIRLGDLYVALVTLSFGLLVENLVFNLSSLNNYGAGIIVARPNFATSAEGFAWFALVVFAILALVFANLRRSTLGMAISAARWSDPGARTIGVSVLWTKVVVGTLAAFVAGIAGGLLAMYAQAAVPASYDTFAGLIWLAVLVTTGIRSASAALLAGLIFGFLPELFLTYLPTSWGEVPPAMFGLGAVLVARNPEGILAMHARQLNRLSRRRKPTGDAELLTDWSGQEFGSEIREPVAK